MGHKIIENMLAPKPEMEVGQVWNTVNNIKVVIETVIDNNVVRAMIIGEDNFGDKYDVVLRKEDYPEILSRDMSTVRGTSFPVFREDLTQYLYSLTPKDKAAMLRSIDKKEEYDELQLRIIGKYSMKTTSLVQKLLNKLEI